MTPEQRARRRKLLGPLPGEPHPEDAPDDGDAPAACIVAPAPSRPPVVPSNDPRIARVLQATRGNPSVSKARR